MVWNGLATLPVMLEFGQFRNVQGSEGDGEVK
jgi:hypothetical protein